MAKPELGTKRIDPETGKKFYDLNKDPIISPFTGKTYARSVFEIPERVKSGVPRAAVKPVVDEEAEDVAVVERDADVISLEEVEEDPEVAGDPSVDEDEAVIAGAEELEIDPAIEADDEAAEPFLEEEEEGDDVAGLLDVDAEDDDEV